MLTLSKLMINNYLNLELLKFDPLIKENIRPWSIDLTLGNTLTICKSNNAVLDVEEFKSIDDEKFDILNIEDGYILSPGETVTGFSKESIKLPQNINGLILNLDHLAMLGIDATISQYITPGFIGHKRIVIVNKSTQKIKIKPGITICTLVLLRMGVE